MKIFEKGQAVPIFIVILLILCVMGGLIWYFFFRPEPPVPTPTIIQTTEVAITDTPTLTNTLKPTTETPTVEPTEITPTYTPTATKTKYIPTQVDPNELYTPQPYKYGPGGPMVGPLSPHNNWLKNDSRVRKVIIRR